MNLKSTKRNNVLLSLVFLAIFFCLPQVVSAEVSLLELVRELYEEKDWHYCEIESRRLLAIAPGNSEVKLLCAQAILWQGRLDTNMFWELALDLNNHYDIRSEAFYSLALIASAREDFDAAFQSAKDAFLLARTNPVLLYAAQMVVKNRWYAKTDVDFEAIKQAKTVLKLYDVKLDEIDKVINQFIDHSEQKKGLSTKLGNAFISFYRKNIRPAIGDRCSLVPSCSEYTKQAFWKHGMLALPMMADRFYREPGVVSRAEKVVEMADGRVLFADPLEDHDWYFDGN